MTLRLRSLCKQLLAVVVLIASHGALLAEQPLTLAEALQKRHVGLSKPELLKALRSPDSHSRGLAAAQLASDHAFDTIPQIAQALSVEPDGLERHNIAQALAHMGDQRGNAALKEARVGGQTME